MTNKTILEAQAEALKEAAKAFNLAKGMLSYQEARDELLSKSRQLRAQAAAEQPTKSEAEQGERERFEAWMIREGWGGALEKMESRPDLEMPYHDSRTQTRWIGWQAGSEHAYLYATARVNSLGGKFARQAAEQPEGEKGERESYALELAGYVSPVDLENVEAAGRGYIFKTPPDLSIPVYWKARSHQAQAVEGRKWKHKKRGTVYTEIGRGHLQTGIVPVTDMCEIVLYRGWDGKLWARPEREFEDGRFEELPATPPTQQEALAHVGEPKKEGETPRTDAEAHVIEWGEQEAYVDQEMVDASFCRSLELEINEVRGQWHDEVKELSTHRPDSATPSPQAMPEGFVLVPRESNSRMMNAGASMLQELQSKLATTRSLQQIVALIWTTMHENAPKDQQP